MGNVTYCGNGWIGRAPKAHKKSKDVDLSQSEIGFILGEDVMPCTDEVDNGALHQAPSVVEPGTESGTSPLLTRKALISAQERDPSLAKCLVAATEVDGSTGNKKHSSRNPWVSVQLALCLTMIYEVH